MSDWTTCAWPMKMVRTEISLPNSDDSVVVTLPRHITPNEWRRMMRTIRSMKHGLVGPTPKMEQQ